MISDNIIDRWNNSEVLLLGGSAGSFKLLFRIARSFPPDLNKAVIIIMHRKKNFYSEVEKLFAENSRMLVKEINDKEPIANNTIYIAPANYHTLIENKSCFALDVSEPVWYSRPSIDVTFDCAADVFKQRCTAILLSGANQDGAAGLLKLKNAGALTIVQDPAEAEMKEMPNAALNINAAGYVLDTGQIIELLTK